VIADCDKRNAMGDIYRRGAGTYLEHGHRNADATGAAQDNRVFSAARYLAANIQRAPVHVIPCIAVDQLPVGPPRHVPVAYTIGPDFKPAQRPQLEDITHWEQW
jgi:hypothetical protein